MQPFTQLHAVAAPLPLENVDTDKILPGRFLKTITRQGLGRYVFWSLRQDTDFVLNQRPWDRAGILITLDNFGCGSSREHAPWALLDFGIRCIIAPTMADIFYNNCFKNGILPILLRKCRVEYLMSLASNSKTALMSVDLQRQKLSLFDGSSLHFDIDFRRKQDLLHGVDDIARTMTLVQSISEYEARHPQVQLPLLGRCNSSPQDTAGTARASGDSGGIISTRTCSIPKNP